MSWMWSFEGACIWHTDWKNVRQSVCPWIKPSFLNHWPPLKVLQTICQYVQPVSYNHIPHQPSNSSSNVFTSKIVRDQPPWRLLEQSICITKEFLYKLSDTVSVKLSYMLISLSRVWTPDLTAVCCSHLLSWANAHSQKCLALWRGGVLFKDESCFSLYRADGRQHVGWRVSLE